MLINYLNMEIMGRTFRQFLLEGILLFFLPFFPFFLHAKHARKELKRNN